MYSKLFWKSHMNVWAKYSKLDKSASADHITSNFLKAVFHKFYLVHSWILCPIYSSQKSLMYHSKQLRSFLNVKISSDMFYWFKSTLLCNYRGSQYFILLLCYLLTGVTWCDTFKHQQPCKSMSFWSNDVQDKDSKTKKHRLKNIFEQNC